MHIQEREPVKRDVRTGRRRRSITAQIADAEIAGRPDDCEILKMDPSHGRLRVVAEADLAVVLRRVALLQRQHEGLLLEHVRVAEVERDISEPNVYDFDNIEFENESGSLIISNNDALINLEGLEKIEYLKTVLIENNDALVSIEALSHLIFISNPGRDSEYPNRDYLKIINNDALLSLRGLDNTKVHHIYIHENDALTNLEGLSSITHLDLLSVKNNSNITSLDGLNNLNEISAYYDSSEIRGYTFIVNNTLLRDLCVLKDVYFFDYPSDDHYQLTGNAHNPSFSQLITTDGCSN